MFCTQCTVHSAQVGVLFIGPGLKRCASADVQCAGTLVCAVAELFSIPPFEDPFFKCTSNQEKSLLNSDNMKLIGRDSKQTLGTSIQ